MLSIEINKFSYNCPNHFDCHHPLQPLRGRCRQSKRLGAIRGFSYNCPDHLVHGWAKRMVKVQDRTHLSFLQATSIQDANVLISSLCLYLGDNQTKLFFYSFPSVEPNVLIFIVLQKFVAWTLVFLDLFFHEQRLIKLYCFGGHLGCEAIIDAPWDSSDLLIIYQWKSSSHKIVHDHPGLWPIAWIEHRWSKRSWSPQLLPVLTIVQCPHIIAPIVIPLFQETAVIEMIRVIIWEPWTLRNVSSLDKLTTVNVCNLEKGILSCMYKSWKPTCMRTASTQVLFQGSNNSLFAVINQMYINLYLRLEYYIICRGCWSAVMGDTCQTTVVNVSIHVRVTTDDCCEHNICKTDWLDLISS